MKDLKHLEKTGQDGYLAAAKVCREQEVTLKMVLTVYFRRGPFKRTLCMTATVLTPEVTEGRQQPRKSTNSTR